jgi:hypothetical protein
MTDKVTDLAARRDNLGMLPARRRRLLLRPTRRNLNHPPTMDSVALIVKFLGFAALAGILGALAMTAVMRLLASTGWARGDMIVAVGSLLTRSRENAQMVGVFLHLISAVFFGMVYTLLLMAIGFTTWPAGLIAGGFFGVFHGLVVSLTLCWIVADQHPVEEFRHVSVSVAISHFIGHVAFGAVAGLVVSFAPL